MSNKKEFNEIDSIIAFEQGELEDSSIIELFQRLVDNGHAWTLQGSYGRMAKALIDSGHVKIVKGELCKD